MYWIQESSTHAFGLVADLYKWRRLDRGSLVQRKFAIRHIVYLECAQMHIPTNTARHFGAHSHDSNLTPCLMQDRYAQHRTISPTSGVQWSCAICSSQIRRVSFESVFFFMTIYLALCDALTIHAESCVDMLSIEKAFFTAHTLSSVTKEVFAAYTFRSITQEVFALQTFLVNDQSWQRIYQPKQRYANKIWISWKEIYLRCFVPHWKVVTPNWKLRGNVANLPLPHWP